MTVDEALQVVLSSAASDKPKPYSEVLRQDFVSSEEVIHLIKVITLVLLLKQDPRETAVGAQLFFDAGVVFGRAQAETEQLEKLL